MNPVDKILGNLREEEYLMARTCDDCGGKKTRKDADLCYVCAKKKAKTLGIKNLTRDQYQFDDI